VHVLANNETECANGCVKWKPSGQFLLFAVDLLQVYAKGKNYDETCLCLTLKAIHIK
jgi:hypothetical protein